MAKSRLAPSGYYIENASADRIPVAALQQEVSVTIVRDETELDQHGGAGAEPEDCQIRSHVIAVIVEACDL